VICASTRWRAGLWLGLLLPGSAGAASGESSAVIWNIAVSMVAASLLGLLMKLLRQPLLLGYILGGVLVGPLGLGLVSERAQIETLAEIGLILLLFMIGLEIDLKKMVDAGKAVLVTGSLQFPLSLGVSLLLLNLLAGFGLELGEGRYAAIYLAASLGISSTMIVVKLLYDKLELDTLPGRFTLGILVFQDVWAIVALAIQPNLAQPELGGLIRTFASGALLVIATLASSRYLLPKIFHLVAKVPELMLVISLGWCFAVGLVAALPQVGLSMEMGALIAGVSLATFPYNLDVNAKVHNIRDFFITLFFVSLGMRIPFPELELVLGALALCGVLLLTRAVGVFGLLWPFGVGHRASILPALNLSQMSEFSLVILSLGVASGDIGERTLTLGIWTFSLLAVGSTYLITANHQVERVLSRLLTRVRIRDQESQRQPDAPPRAHPVVLLGFYRIGEAFLEEVLRRDQHLKAAIRVVDLNPDVHRRLTLAGVDCVYGDISHADTLHHAQVHHAKVLVSTVPDSALRGTTNAKLLKVLKEAAASAQVIVTAEGPEQARALYASGADYVLQPAALAGGTLLTAVEQAIHGGCEGLREEAQQTLATGPHAELADGARPIAQA
jgi:Kef-type K+ transport system membrane component KefB